jgi:CysZ protein
MNTPIASSPIGIISCLLQALHLLGDKRLRLYLIIPLLINTALYSLAFYLGYHSVAALIDNLIPSWLHWLNWILWPLFLASFLVIGFFSFTLLANLIAAPSYSRLSAKTLEIIGKTPKTKTEQPFSQLLLAELKRMRYIVLRMLPLAILFLIPVVNLIAPILWTMFAAWGMAMEFMAYPLEERGLLFTEQKQFLQQNRISILTFGGIIAFGMTLPVVNLLICQVAVIAATIFVQQAGLVGNQD